MLSYSTVLAMEENSVPFEIRFRGVVTESNAPELLKASASLAEALGSVSLEHSVEIKLNTSESDIELPQTPLEVLTGVTIRKTSMDKEELEISLREMGVLIRERRKEKRHSLRSLGAVAGITPAYLGIIEKGANPKTNKPSRPSFDILQKIATELQIDLKELLTMTGYEIVPTANDET